jgi:hypothetical protein
MIFYYIPYLHNHGRLQHRVCQRRCWGSYAANPSSFSTFSIRMIEDGVLYPIFLPPQLCPRAWSFPNQRCNSRGRPSVTSASRVSFTRSPVPRTLFSCSQYPFRCRSILRVHSLPYASTALPLLTIAQLVQGSRPAVVAVSYANFSSDAFSTVEHIPPLVEEEDEDTDEDGSIQQQALHGAPGVQLPITRAHPEPGTLHQQCSHPVTLISASDLPVALHSQCRYPVTLSSASDLPEWSCFRDLLPEAMPNFGTEPKTVGGLCVSVSALEVRNGCEANSTGEARKTEMIREKPVLLPTHSSHNTPGQTPSRPPRIMTLLCAALLISLMLIYAVITAAEGPLGTYSTITHLLDHAHASKPVFVSMMLEDIPHCEQPHQ